MYRQERQYQGLKIVSFPKGKTGGDRKAMYLSANESQS